MLLTKGNIYSCQFNSKSNQKNNKLHNLKLSREMQRMDQGMAPFYMAWWYFVVDIVFCPDKNENEWFNAVSWLHLCVLFLRVYAYLRPLKYFKFYQQTCTFLNVILCITSTYAHPFILDVDAYYKCTRGFFALLWKFV